MGSSISGFEIMCQSRVYRGASHRRDPIDRDSWASMCLQQQRTDGSIYFCVIVLCYFINGEIAVRVPVTSTCCGRKQNVHHSMRLIVWTDRSRLHLHKRHKTAGIRHVLLGRETDG